MFYSNNEKKKFIPIEIKSPILSISYKPKKFVFLHQIISEGIKYLRKFASKSFEMRRKNCENCPQWLEVLSVDNYFVTL